MSRSLNFPILLHHTGSRVCDTKRAVGVGGELDPVARGFIQVCYPLVCEIFCACILRAMQLPYIQACKAVEQSEHVCGAAFCASVVDNGNSRFKCSKRGRVGSIGTAMVGNEVSINLADEIDRTDKIKQWLAGKITHVEKSKLAELQDEPRRSRVLVGLLC